MAYEQTFAVDLDDTGRMVVLAEPVGGSLVAEEKIITKLADITSSIQHVSHDVLAAVSKAGPSKATVELGFGLAVEAGQVVALFGKGKGEATIRVTLEWDRSEQEAHDASATRHD